LDICITCCNFVVFLGYFNLFSQNSGYSLKVGIVAVVFFVLYVIVEGKYAKTFMNLRKKLTGKSETSNSKFLKFIFNKTHFMNYTYSYFGGVMAAITIAFVLGQKPLSSPLYTMLIFFLITFTFGLCFSNKFHICK